MSMSEVERESLLGSGAGGLSRSIKALLGVVTAVSLVSFVTTIVTLAEVVTVKKTVNNITTSSSESSQPLQTPYPIQTPIPIQTPYPIVTPFPSQELPIAFRVNDDFITPIWDQDGLGTCWAFSTLNILESQYRKQGIENGWLEKDEYVRLSVQAYFSFLGLKVCSDKASAPSACNYGGMSKNSSEDGQVEQLYYFQRDVPALRKSILPDSVCPYVQMTNRSEPFDFFNCSGLDAALETNPIEWAYKSQSSAYGTTQIKELLYKKQRPVSIGTPLLNLVFYPLCTEAPWNVSEECLNQAVPCPDIEGQFCAKIEVDGRFQDGVFLGESDTRKIAEMGGHAMNLVGWNDEAIVRERFQAPSGSDSPPAETIRGGFILRNSWGTNNGHSIDYWYGVQSEENEAVVCPNTRSPDNWIPVSEPCLLDGWNDLVLQLQNGSVPELRCPNVAENESVIERIRGKGIHSLPDILKCTDSTGKFCNNSAGVYYVLAKEEPDSSDADVQYVAGGLHSIGLLKFDVTLPSEEGVEKIRINRLPFWALSRAFSVVNVSRFQNDPDLCGYWLLPYSVLERTRRINWDLLDNFRVWDMEVEFTPGSYIRSGQPTPGKDYSWINASTRVMRRQAFDGPVPFDLIYGL